MYTIIKYNYNSKIYLFYIIMHLVRLFFFYFNDFYFLACTISYNIKIDK